MSFTEAPVIHRASFNPLIRPYLVLYVAGAVLSLFVILDKIPGGWEHVVAVAGAKFTVLDLRTDFLGAGYEIVAGSPEQFTAAVKRDQTRYRSLIRAIGLEAH